MRPRDIFSAIAAVTMLLCGCAEQEPTERPIADHEIELQLSARMPSITIPSTRAMNRMSENAVRTLDVLVFTADGTGEAFAYSTRAYGIGTSGKQVTFSVKLRTDSPAQSRLVLLANSATPTIGVGTAKAAALASITFTPSTHWNSGYDYLPMWGQMPQMVAVSATTAAADFGQATLLRSLSRVNVVNADPNFTLSNVTICNARNLAAVAPSQENLNGTGTKVTAPTVPTSAAAMSFGLPVTDNALVNEIYIGEYDNATATDAEAIYLIAEGSYNGTPSCYRIDMANMVDGTFTRYDIMRNHTYNITLVRLGGTGFATPAEAAAAVALNRTGAAGVDVVDDAELNNLTTDGTYTLRMENDRIELPVTAGSCTFRCESDYAGPITVVLDSPTDWITSFVYDADQGVLTFDYTAHDSTDLFGRQTTATITAGRIVKQIIITQGDITAVEVQTNTTIATIPTMRP